MSIIPFCYRARRFSFATLLQLALLLGVCLFAPKLFAAQCWINGAMNINFGNTDVKTDDYIHSNLNYTCQAPYDASGAIYHVRLCVFVQPDEMGTVNPHSLRRWDNTIMHYQLYSDAARTLLVGPINGNMPAYSWSFDLSSNSQYSSQFSLYGKIPARQAGLSSGTYESHFNGGVVRWRWSKGIMPTPSVNDCLADEGGSGGGSVNYFINVTANVLDSCLINTATDLNFGVVDSQIHQNIDQSAMISLSCPLGAVWKLSLNNGMNALGNQRRMRNGNSSYINYNLYKNSARTQAWGAEGILNIVDGIGLGQTRPINVPIYGRVPSQPAIQPGNYQDQVTITLTY